MHKLLSLHERFPYILPIISPLVVIITLPPFNLWPLILVALVPVYLFIFQEKNIHRVFIGVLFPGLILGGYLYFIIFSGFIWIPEAYLFSDIVKLFGIPIVLFASAAVALTMCLLKTGNSAPTPLGRAILFGVFFSVIEWVVGKMFIGFDYASFAYAASHIPALRFFASIGGTFLVTFILVFGNAAFAETLRFLFQEKKRSAALLIPLGIFSALVGVSFAYQYISSSVTPAAAPSSISIAVIQDSTRKKGAAFGKVVDGSFQFPLLEKRVKEALALRPDIIIYPFSPWVGVIADRLDNGGFTKDVVGMDFSTFKKWLTAYIPPETTLVTWNTRLEGEKYWNEIAFWKNGVLMDSYQKIKLFPFFDYTPRWAEQLGIYSTPVDAAAGTSTAPVSVGKAVIGSLVCSEVSRPGSARENGKIADVLFAIGSEAMFTSSLASEFNLLNAKLRATESGRYVIRANKFGSSALIDPYGNVVKGMAYNQSGILFVKVPIQTERKTTPYSVVTEYPFLIFLVGYALFLWSKKSKN